MRFHVTSAFYSLYSLFCLSPFYSHGGTFGFGESNQRLWTLFDVYRCFCHGGRSISEYVFAWNFLLERFWMNLIIFLNCAVEHLTGMFYDATNDYDASFYLSGSMILISGILCYPLGYINRWEKKRNNAIQNNKQKIKQVPEPEPVFVA